MHCLTGYSIRYLAFGVVLNMAAMFRRQIGFLSLPILFPNSYWWYHILDLFNNSLVYITTFFIFCYLLNQNSSLIESKIVSEYDQEIPQSQTADNPVAPRGRAAQPP